MNQVIPLAMARPGWTVQIVSVQGGRRLQRRLADMGLSPGVLVSVLNSQTPGPVILSLRGSRLALGHGMTMRILVRIA
jgi:ferrous iron transport protein A